MVECHLLTLCIKPFFISQLLPQELEQIEEHWREESRDLEAMVSHLQEENRKLSSLLAEKKQAEKSPDPGTVQLH